MKNNTLENMTAEAFATLLQDLRQDYANGRVVMCDNGWITSKSEWQLLNNDAEKPEENSGATSSDGVENSDGGHS